MEGKDNILGSARASNYGYQNGALSAASLTTSAQSPSDNIPMTALIIGDLDNLINNFGAAMQIMTNKLDQFIGCGNPENGPIPPPNSPGIVNIINEKLSILYRLSAIAQENAQRLAKII